MNKTQVRARNEVGGHRDFDVIGGLLFARFIALGLREHHRVLDIGCGCLRVGKLFLAFLEPGNYAGVEPQTWILDAGIEHEAGHGLVEFKQARFSNTETFDFASFGGPFDMIWAGSVFSHTCPQQTMSCLLAVRNQLAPGAAFHATFIEPGPAATQRGMPPAWTMEAWTPGGLTYTVEEMQKCAHEAGMEVSFGDYIRMSANVLAQRWATFRCLPED